MAAEADAAVLRARLKKEGLGEVEVVHGAAGTVRVGVEFWAEGGWLVQPEDDRDLGAAYARMVSELVANIDAGETRHRCDVRFGRDVVEILTRCEAVLDTR